MDDAERDRLTTTRLRVLAFLRQQGARGALNHEICTPDIGGLDGMRRVRELRAQGEHITKTLVAKGIWRYTWSPQP